MLLLLAAAMYLGTFIYHSRYSSGQMTLAESIAEITSTVTPNPITKSSGVALEPSYLAVTEERSIVLIIIVSVLFCLASFVLLIKEKRVAGNIGIQDQLLAVSVILVVTILATSWRQGIL